MNARLLLFVLFAGFVAALPAAFSAEGIVRVSPMSEDERQKAVEDRLAQERAYQEEMRKARERAAQDPSASAEAVAAQPRGDLSGAEAEALLERAMPNSVSSWEGEFTRTPDEVTVQIEGHDSFRLCFYQLAGESGGIVVGIADAKGERIISPVPNHRGVQPIYRGHVVTIRSKHEAEPILMFQVQGQGGVELVIATKFRTGRSRWSVVHTTAGDTIRYGGMKN